MNVTTACPNARRLSKNDALRSSKVEWNHGHVLYDAGNPRIALKGSKKMERHDQNITFQKIPSIVTVPTETPRSSRLSSDQQNKKKAPTTQKKSSQAGLPKVYSLRRPRSEPATLRRSTSTALRKNTNPGTKNAVWPTSSSPIASVMDEEDASAFLYDHSHSSTATTSSTSTTTTTDTSSSFSNSVQRKDHQTNKKTKKSRSSLHQPKSEPLLRRTSNTSHKHGASCTKNAVWSTSSSPIAPSKKSLQMRTAMEDVQGLSHERSCPNTVTTTSSSNANEDSFCSLHQHSTVHPGSPQSNLVAETERPKPKQEQAFSSPIAPRRLISHAPVVTQGGLTTTTTHQKRAIELKSGVVLPWRDSAETAQCIEQGNHRFTTCHGCGNGLCCLPDISYVLCPHCKFATPLQCNFNECFGPTSENGGGGIALGASLELLHLHNKSVVWQEQQYRKCMTKA